MVLEQMTLPAYVGFDLVPAPLEQIPSPVCDGSEPLPVASDRSHCLWWRRMPLPATPGTQQEQSPTAFEQMPLPTAPGTKQEQSPVASEQMLSPIVLGTEHEPLPSALE